LLQDLKDPYGVHHEYGLDSEQMAELQEAAATLIQKVWRGFSTRKVLEGIFDVERSFHDYEEEEILADQDVNIKAHDEVNLRDNEDFSGEESVENLIKNKRSPEEVFNYLEG
jgi:hypothetical protein